MSDQVTITTTTDNVTIAVGGTTTATVSPPAVQSVTVTAPASGVSDLSSFTSDNLSEGSSNLFFTNARAAAASPVHSVGSSTGINTLTSASGAVSITNTKLGTVTGLTMPSGYSVADSSGALTVSYNNTATIRTGLGLVPGTGVSNLVQLDSNSKIPAVDGSQVTALNMDSASSGTLAVARGGTGATSAAGIRTGIGVTNIGSYTGQIETAADKVYTIDPTAATARTITGFYIKCGSGTVTATLKNAAATVKAASVSTSSGDQSSLANSSVSANAAVSITLSSNSSATDVIFAVEYTE